MGLFSNISDFFKSSNSLAKTSHQKAHGKREEERY